MGKIFNVPFSDNFLEQFVKKILDVSNNFENPQNNLILLPHKRIQNAFFKKLLFFNTRIVLPKVLTFTTIDENILEFDRFCNSIHVAKFELVKKQILKNDQTYILISLILESIKNQNTNNKFDTKFLNSIDLHKLSKSVDEYYYYQYYKKEIIPNTKIEKLFLLIIAELESYLQSTNTIFKAHSLNYTTEEIIKNWNHNGNSCIFIILPQTEVSYIKHFIDNLVRYKNSYIFIRGFDKDASTKNLHQMHIHDFLDRNNLAIDSVQDVSKLNQPGHYMPSIILNNITENFYQTTLKNLNIISGKNLNEEAKMVALIIREKLEMGKNSIIVQTKSYELAKKIESSLKLWNINVDNLVNNIPEKSTCLHFFLLISLYLNTEKNDYLLLLDILKSSHCRVDNQLINTFELKFLRKLLYRDKVSDYLIGLNDLDKDKFSALIEIENKFLSKKRLLKNPNLTLLDYFKIHLKLFDFLKNDSDNIEFQELLILIEQKLEIFKNYHNLNFTKYIKITDKLLTSNQKSSNSQNPISVTILQTFETRNIQYDTVFFAGLNEGVFPDANFDKNYFSKGFRQMNNLKPIDSEMQFMEYDFISSFYNNDLILSCSESTNAKNQICRWLEKLLAFKSINAQSAIFTEKYKKILQNIYKQPFEKNSDIAYAKVGVDQRPKKISVTGIEKLISNPYVYYARYILKVNPLEKIAREAEKKEFGILLHDLIPKALSVQHANSEEFSNWFFTKFNEYIECRYIPYKISKFWFLRLGNITDSIYKNFYHQNENYKSFSEIVGTFNLKLQSHNIELFCIADRIEISQQDNIRPLSKLASEDKMLGDLGGQNRSALDVYEDSSTKSTTQFALEVEFQKSFIVEIIDFKSGYVPNQSEVSAGLYPQLPIEKYILQKKGFKLDINTISVVNLHYFDISGKSKDVKKKSIHGDSTEIERELKLLLEKFLCNETDFFITKDIITNKRNKNYSHILRI